MYDNIGGKIKGLAKGIFIAMAILGFLTGVVFIAIDKDMAWLGLLCIALYPLIGWISSWMLYGFGEIIDKLTVIESNTRADKKNPVSVELSERARKLEKLCAQGLITEEEYQRAMAKKI